jgi:hypothetical protein
MRGRRPSALRAVGTAPPAHSHGAGDLLTSTAPVMGYYRPMRKKRFCLGRTRRGTPCLPVVQRYGHQDQARRVALSAASGLSTGPKSPEGKARISAAARARWEDRLLPGWTGRSVELTVATLATGPWSA